MLLPRPGALLYRKALDLLRSPLNPRLMLVLQLAQTVRARLLQLGSFQLATVLLCCLAIAGCATPVGVERVDLQTAYRAETRSILTGDDLSAPTRIVLTRWDLDKQFATAPNAALAALQARVVDGTGGRDEIFALAELSLQQGLRTGKRTDYLAASVYAFAFLFPDGADAPPDAFDPRLRIACDLYDRGLVSAFESADHSHVELQDGDFALPFGTLRVAFDPQSLVWANQRLIDFIPIDRFEVYGLRNRYRQAGLGAPLAASGAPLRPEQGFQVAPRLKIPVTAVLRISNPRKGLAAGTLDATLKIYTPSDPETVQVGGQEVPLAIDRTAALAYTLANKDIWARELRGFLVGDLLDTTPTQLVALEPYQPGLFPVVFIHGTASSAGRWADMVNELMSDPRIREHFQFWAFSYNTGNPIPYSALLLREALRDAVTKIDPGGKDLALRHMVLIGHSQGGLLAKMAVVDSGSRFWDGISRKPLDALTMSDQTRDLARRVFYFDHSPFVSRVIFVATPQRGSYVAGFSLVQTIAKLVRLPANLARATSEVLTNNPDVLRFDPERFRVGTSVYGMAPGSPFITALEPLPIAPGIAAHSIIAVTRHRSRGGGRRRRCPVLERTSQRCGLRIGGTLRPLCARRSGNDIRGSPNSAAPPEGGEHRGRRARRRGRRGIARIGRDRPAIPIVMAGSTPGPGGWGRRCRYVNLQGVWYNVFGRCRPRFGTVHVRPAR